MVDSLVSCSDRLTGRQGRLGDEGRCIRWWRAGRLNNTADTLSGHRRTPGNVKIGRSPKTPCLGRTHASSFAPPSLPFTLLARRCESSNQTAIPSKIGSKVGYGDAVAVSFSAGFGFIRFTFLLSPGLRSLNAFPLISALLPPPPSNIYFYSTFAQTATSTTPSNTHIPQLSPNVSAIP